MTILPLFTVLMLRPLWMISNVLDVVESECDSYTRTFGTLSAGIRTVFRISNYAKSDNSLFMRHLCVLPSKWKQKELATE